MWPQSDKKELKKELKKDWKKCETLKKEIKVHIEIGKSKWSVKKSNS